MSPFWYFQSDLKSHLHDIEICTVRVSERSSLVGKSLAQIGLRNKYGVTLLAIRRDSQIVSNPGGAIRFCANDVLFVLGSPDRIAQATSLFDNPKERRVHESDISGTK